MAKEVNVQEFQLLDKVSAGLATIGGNFLKLKINIVALSSAADLASRAIGAIGSAADGIGDAIGAAADYQTTLARLNDETKATSEQQIALQAAIRATGDALGVSLDDAATAALLLAKEGATADEVVRSLGVVMGFAKANSESASTAIAGLDAVLDSFGENAGQIGAVADALTAVADRAGGGTKALAEGLAGSGAAAASANVSINETLELLGALAERNIAGADAGKRLTTILEGLTDPAGAAAEALASIGLKGAPVSDIIARLSTDSEAAEKVLSSFGVKPKLAFEALLKDGGAALTKFNAIVAGSAGASEKAASAVDGTFRDALMRLQNQVGELRTDFLTPVLAPIAGELDTLTKRLDAFSKSETFKQITAKFGELAVAGIEAAGDLVESFDFETAIKETSGGIL